MGTYRNKSKLSISMESFFTAKPIYAIRIKSLKNAKKQYCKIVYSLIFNLLLCLNLFAQVPKLANERRGIVIYPSDITSLGALNWVDLLSKNNINLIGIHTDTGNTTQ